MKLQVSLSSWIQNVLPHHFLFSFDSPAPVSCWLEENCLVYALEDVRFLNFLSRWAPVSWMLFRRLFFHRHTPDWPEIPNFVKRFPNSFARARAIPDMDLLSPLESLHSKSSSGLFSTWRFSFQSECLGWTLLLVECKTSITMSQRSRASNRSIRNPASRDMTSDSLQLCETEVCFLHIQLTGTNVLLPKKHKTPP